MNIPLFFRLSGLILLLSSGLHASKNVVFIMVDDMRPETPSYGANHVITPSLDTLASQGMVFNKAYCQAAICQPSRSSVMTGVRPDITGEHDIDPADSFRNNMASVVTLPEHFKANGYHTQATGKIFHFGDAASWSLPSISHFDNGENHYHEAGNNFNSGNKPAFESSDTPDSEYMDYKVAGTAIDIIEARANQATPFFLAVGFWKPHLPFSAPESYWDLYNPASLPLPSAANSVPPVNALPGIYRNSFSGELTTYPTGLPVDGNDDTTDRITWHGDTHLYPESYKRQLIHGYLACVSFVDAQIGRVIARLEDPNGDSNTDDSILDDTIIVVVGDHGFHLGEEGTYTKRTNFDIAARVPLYIVAPGVTDGGEITEAPTEMLDLFPTLTALAGLPIPTTHTLQGHDLTPTLTDPNVHVKDYAAFQEEFIGSSIPGRGYSIRTDRWRYTEWRLLADGKVVAYELYDLENDPEENLNLGDYPAYTKIMADLETKLGALDGIGPNTGGGPSDYLTTSSSGGSSPTPTPTVKESFDYSAGTLASGQAGGTGLSGGWYGNRGLSFGGNSGSDVVAEILTAPSGYGFTPAGNAAANGTNTNGAHRAFAVANQIDLAADGTHYFSFLYKHSSGANWQLSFADSSASIVGLQFANGGALQSTTGETANFHSAGVFADGVTYLIAGRIVASAAGNDQIQVSVYPSAGSVSASTPVSFDASQTFTSSATIDRFGMGQANAVAFGSTGNAGVAVGSARWDEFLMGAAWIDVIGDSSSSGGTIPPADIVESFDYSAGTLASGQAGGSGLSGGWYGNRGLSFGGNSGSDIVAETLSAPSGYGYTPAGNAAANGNNTNGAHRAFTAGNSIDLSVDGTHYFSFLYQHSSGANWQLSFADSSGSVVGLQFAGGGALQSTLAYTTNFHSAGVFADGVTYLVAGRIVASAAGNDQIQVSVYPASGSVVSSTPATFDASQTFTSSATLDRFGMGQADAVAFGSTGNAGVVTGTARWDEFRMGDSWEAIVGVAVGGGGGSGDSGPTVEPTPIYIPFDYTGTTIGVSNAAGVGFRHGWTGNRALSFGGAAGIKVSTAALSKPTGYGFTPVGNAATNAVSGDSGSTNVAHAWIRTGRELDFGIDGEHHFSFLYRHSNAANWQLSFANESASIAGLQIAGGGAIQSTVGSSTVATIGGAFTDGADHLVVGRILTSASGDDRIEARAYPASGSIPSSQPSYSFSTTFQSSAVVDRIGMGQANATAFGGGVGTGAQVGTAIWDEFRVGTSYLQVTGQKAIALPTADGLALRGSNNTGATLTSDYVFSDPDGDAEGFSTYRWLVADTAEGTYDAVAGEDLISLLLSGSLDGKWLKFEVTPVASEQPAVGDAVTSRAVQVGAALPTELANTEYKLQEDNALTIAFFGGSITDGWSASDKDSTSWRALVSQWFEGTYPQAAITSLNLGMSSTGSELGVFRADRDLINNDVDLVFVEFAVNDESGPAISDARAQESMEGITRKLRKQLPRADIVFVYTTTSSVADTYYGAAGTPPKVLVHQAVAAHYGVPESNVGLAMYNDKTTTGDPWNTYLPDGVHPSDTGYQIYADTLTAQFADWLPPVVPDNLILQSLPALLSANDLSTATMLEPDAAAVTIGSGWSMVNIALSQDISGDFLQTTNAGTAGNLTVGFDGPEIGVYFQAQAGAGGQLAWDIDSGSASGNFTTNTSFTSSYSMLSTALSDAAHSVTLDPATDAGDTLRIGGWMVWPGNPSGLENWQYANFRHLDGGIGNVSAQLTANPDGDPFVNRLDYAFGLDPFTIDPISNMPAVALTEVSGSEYLSLSYRRLKGSGTGTTAAGYQVGGITYTVEQSNTLATASWDTGSLLLQEVSIDDNFDGTETVTVRSKAAISDEDREFLRLQVSE